MAFTDDDRSLLARTAALLEAMKESHDRRLAALEAEDKVLHHRINVTRKAFLGLSSGIGIIAGAVIVWIKSNMGVK